MRGQKTSFKQPHGAITGSNDPMASGRAGVNKSRSAKEFTDNTKATKAANITYQAGTMRGGIRL